MKTAHQELRSLFSDFWESKDHKEVPPIPLVPQNDPTTLFTGSGMQPLVPYLLGEPHPLGEKLFNIQPCFRAQDIEEIGNHRHTTHFEMMGNWSLGTYFKKEQIPWYFEFLTKKLKFEVEKLFVTVFDGYKEIPRDTESAELWKILGIRKEHISYYGPEKNWWTRSGHPDDMPAGEPGGPDTEVFYDFGEERKIHENSVYHKENCHPNCDCGRFVEIGNSVFMQYQKQKDGSFAELPKKNVDFGGGFERTLAALNDDPDVFTTDLFTPLIKSLEEETGKKYKDESYGRSMRIIADHIKGSVFLIKDGVQPSNKEQGYILRRLLRRAAIKYRSLVNSFKPSALTGIAVQTIKSYQGVYFDVNKDQEYITRLIEDEMRRFGNTLERGLKEAEKVAKIDGKKAFDLYQTYGFPLEVTEELFKEKGQKINHEEFIKEFEKHKNLSRTAATGKFKGGLADHSDQVLKYHTATHLLHQALFDVLGDDIRQEGSNITKERLRFDFYSPYKPDQEKVKKVEDVINKKIKEELPMRFKIMSKEDAYRIGARSFFREKYSDKVKVYYLGGEDDKPETAYSLEFCGGPHVKNTKAIKKIIIYKFENIGSNLYRVYAK